MIIKLFLDALYNVFKVLTTPINIPMLDSDVSAFIDESLNYINAGVGILANYTDIGYLLILFGAIISIDVGIALYHFVMWIIRKIPMANIS